MGSKRLDRITIRDIQGWLNKPAATCQCCAQGKDGARPEDRRRCCDIGKCCQQYTSARTIQAARNVLRTALNHAMTEELLARNPAALARVRRPRKQRLSSGQWTRLPGSWSPRSTTATRSMPPTSWSSCSACARAKSSGLTWNDDVCTAAAELHVNWQLQRVSHNRLHSDTKTEGSAAVLPLPDICLTALKSRRGQQDQARAEAGDAWHDLAVVFTTRCGTPIELRNFNRSFHARCARAGVRRIRGA